MSPCRKCDAKCCKYFVKQLDTPRSNHDFENIRWFLAHKEVTIYTEKRHWFMQVDNECKYLAKDSRCKIYEKRPLICREHSVKSCEYVSDEYAHDKVFKTIEELDIYLDKRFRRNT